MWEQFLTSEATSMALARFIVIVLGGFIFTRTVLMPVTRKLASRKVKTVTTQASIENITGIIFGISFLSLGLQLSGFGGLVTLLGTVTAALTVAIGFGMRDEVGSLVSGLFIQINRPYISGDYVEIGETRGRVKEIQLRSTLLENTQSEKVVMPNKLMTSDALKNYTRGRKTKTFAEVKAPLDYSEKVMKELSNSAEKTEKVLKNPEPSASISKLEDNSAVIQLECFVGSSKEVGKVRSEILEDFSSKEKVKEIFAEKEG